jgi:hypothetical protein
MRYLAGAAVLITGLVIVEAIGRAQSPWMLAEHSVATGLRGAYQVVATDLNKDGRVDLLAILLTGSADVVWFENPSWKSHVIASGVTSPVNADAFDIDKDGIPEIALASGFGTTPARSEGRLTLLTHGADPSAPWTAKEFDRTPAAHRIRWIDADGSGRRMLVNAPLGGINGAPPDYKDKASIYAYDARDLKRATVTDSEEGVVHGISIVDWDGKGREGFLSASFLGIHLHRFVNGAWQRTRLTAGNSAAWPNGGSSDVVALRTKAGRQLAAIEPWHGNQVIVYRGSGETWDQRTMIDDSMNNGHTLAAADLDGDGVDEFVAGYRGNATVKGGLNLFHLEGTTWVKTAIDRQDMAASSCVVAMLNEDKRPDIACIGSSTANLKWYEYQPVR